MRLKREQINLYAATIIVFICVLIVNQILIANPKKDAIARVKAEILRVENEIKKAERFKANYVKKLKELAVLEKKLEELKKRLPKKEDIPNVIRSIVKLAYYSGVDFLSLRMKKEKVFPEKHYAVIDMDIKFSSTYGQLMAFLYGIDGMERLLKPATLSVKSTGISSNPKLSVSGILQTYRYVEEKPKPKKKRRKR